MPTGNKLRLIWQTTGDGLVYRGSGAPVYTPTSTNNAWMYLDTTSNIVYHYDDGVWKNILANLKMPVDSIIFNADNDGTVGVGEIAWNDTDGTLDLGMKGGNITLQIGQEELHYVRNETGTPLTVGTVVYINGVSGQRPTVQRSESDTEIGSSVTFGVVTEPITSGQSGFVTVSGYVRGINTGSYTPGQALWLDTIAGQFTNVKPHAPLHAVLVGYCITSTTDGTIFVKIQNGYELEELHDVLITSPTNGQTIRYLADSLYWKNDSIIKASDVGVINTVNIADSSIVYDKLSQALKDSLSGYQGNITLTTTGTSGAATFSNDTLNIPQYSGSTDLSFSGSSSPVTLNSSTGTDVVLSAGSGISFSANSDTLTITSTGGGGSVTGTDGRVFYADSTGSAVANDSLSWDYTNKRLGVNKTSPTATLDVNGTSSLGGNTAITGSASGTAFNVKNGSGQDIIVAGASGAIPPITVTNSSGTYIALGVETSFAPTSGAGTFNLMYGAPIVNQSNAVGVTRGLYLNPTLTSAPDWRSIEWSNNSGFGLYGSGSANNYLEGLLTVGNSTPSAKLHVRGIGTTTNETFVVENLSGIDNFRVLDNGRIEIGRNTAATTQATATIAAAGVDGSIGITIAPKGNGAIVARESGNARGNSAVDLQLGGSNIDVASGNRSAILGASNSRATADLSSVVGGSVNYATGSQSIVLGGDSNTASSTNAACLGGTVNKAQGIQSVTVGGSSSTASGSNSSVVGGNTSTASGANSSVVGSTACTASGSVSGIIASTSSTASGVNSAVMAGSSSLATTTHSVSFGGGARSDLYGFMAIGSGSIASSSDAQTSNMRLRRAITGTSQTELFLDGISLRAVLPITYGTGSGPTSGRIWNARVQIVATVVTVGTGPDTLVAGSSFIGNYTLGIKRIGTNTSLIGSVQTDHTPQSDLGMETCVVTIDADDTNEALRVQFTPPFDAASNTVIRVVATVYLTEVGY